MTFVSQVNIKSLLGLVHVEIDFIHIHQIIVTQLTNSSFLEYWQSSKFWGCSGS